MTPHRTRLVSALLLTLAAATQASAEAQTQRVGQLAWLAGCWAHVGAEPGSGEIWMPPAGGQLLSVGRSVEGGRVTSFEFQRIAEEGPGLALYASPSGTPAVRFALKSLTASEAVFENPANDFPQRVIYRLAQSGNISARIEGAKDDLARAVDFPMKRTSCENAGKP